MKARFATFLLLLALPAAIAVPNTDTPSLIPITFEPHDCAFKFTSTAKLQPAVEDLLVTL